MANFTSNLEDTMTEEVLTLFTDRLLNEKVLQCSICNEMLVAPIRLVSDIGNVCGSCYSFKSTTDDMKGIRNTSLEYIMTLLYLPCKYKQKGCKQRFSYIEFENHVNTCAFRLKKCPMIYMNCTWEGNANDFMSHFIDSHSENIIKSDSNTFTVCIHFSNSVILRLVCLKNEIFLLKMSVNTEKNKLFYILSEIKDLENYFDYSVKHKGIDGDTTYIKTKSKICPSKNIYEDLNEINSTVIDLEALKAVISNSQEIVNVFILKNAFIQREEMEDKMIHFFECPVCKTFMKPPIFQCHSGHSVCNLCRPRLDKCPTCRASFGSTRNYSLEGLTSGVQYPCTYHDLGCTETATASQITKHEVLCNFKPYKCPMAGCSLTGSHEMIMNHLEEFHKDKLITMKFQRYSESFRLDQSIYGHILDRRCLIADNRIFRISCKRSGDYCLWAAEIMGSHTEGRTYIYEVSIIDMKRPEKKISRTDYCLNEMSEDELFKKCIMFPNTILSSYSSNGLITFQFSIKFKPA